MCILGSCRLRADLCITTMSILSMWEQLVTQQALFGFLVRTSVETEDILLVMRDKLVVTQSGRTTVVSWFYFFMID